MGMAYSQEVSIEGAEALPMDTTRKKIEDYAQLRFFYKATFVEDTLHREKKTEAQCVLEIGKKGSSFKDFYILAVDSLNDAITRQNGTAMELFAHGSGWLKKSKWMDAVLKGYPSGMDYHQNEVSALISTFEYSCPSPTFDWMIGDETKDLMGYTCRKATCHYSGRDYTAWYAEDIPLSDGPYVFRGLPGLIVAISSDDGEYSFDLNGSQTIDFYSPIYLKLVSRSKIATRKEVRKSIKNICENYSEAIMNQTNIKFQSLEDAKTIRPKPYNPLEKE